MIHVWVQGFELTGSRLYTKSSWNTLLNDLIGHQITVSISRSNDHNHWADRWFLYHIIGSVHIRELRSMVVSIDDINGQCAWKNPIGLNNKLQQTLK